MAYILKNRNLEIHIDSPLENYNFSRFDWTGKIVQVKFQNIQVTGVEDPNSQTEHLFGKGLYNEFGIDTPLGFEETPIGGWFHKIGVGLLKKEHSEYRFDKAHKIIPAEFKVISEPDSIIVSCWSDAVNGYSYILRKEIILLDYSFTIKYNLENTGKKDICTNEYAHNFMAINEDEIGSDYQLNFPFQLRPEFFEETVNPELKVDIGVHEIRFNGTPTEAFFYAKLSGNEEVAASWELTNLKSKIAIKETGDFQATKVNLWGCGHVISPELFFSIFIKSGQSTEWSRTYTLNKVT